jgi:peptidoglycan/LPS O-acetylase OafA/YrhL
MLLSKQFGHIQILRGIAVLLVLAFHAYEPIIPLGYLGVDIFFVISGFVISPSIVNIAGAQTAKEA